MKKWAIAVALLLAGILTAVAVAGSTQTVSVCATASTPAHTIAVDGAGVTTLIGDTETNCSTSTYTIPDPVTTTVTQTVTTSPTPTATGTGIGVELYNHLSNITNPNIYGIVVGGTAASDASVEASVKGLGLAYFDGTDVATTYSTGVPYSQASANGWLLKDSAGNLLVNSSFNTYCADVGSTAYQQAWISNVLAWLSAHPGVDGVFNDNTLYDPKADCGAYPAKYPDTASWSAAMLSFVQAVDSALSAHGYYFAVNAGAYIAGNAGSNDGSNTVTWWKELGPYVDGLMNEYYDETSDGTYRPRSTGTAWYQQFDAWQKLIGVAQSFNDDFLGIEYQTTLNTAAATYGKASFLLEWNGGNSAFMFQVHGSSVDPTDPSWTTSIGAPEGAKFAVGVGYQRAYTGGTVIVNPSPTASQTFTVNGSSITLAPTTAKIVSNP